MERKIQFRPSKGPYLRTAALTMPTRIALTLAATAAVALTGAAPAHADVLCSVTENTWVRSAPWGSVLYTIPKGGGFRVHWFSGDWAYGHGNGRADGYAPGWQLKNCH